MSKVIEGRVSRLENAAGGQGFQLDRTGTIELRLRELEQAVGGNMLVTLDALLPTQERVDALEAAFGGDLAEFDTAGQRQARQARVEAEQTAEAAAQAAAAEEQARLAAQAQADTEAADAAETARLDREWREREAERLTAAAQQASQDAAVLKERAKQAKAALAATKKGSSR